jgi:serine/threonine-protein kinase
MTPETVSSARADTPRGLRRRLEGDLDAVVLMALRKEPHSRYGSVGQLAEDVQRVLEGLPVRARTPTLAYRASRFLRRHKAAVAAAVAAALSLAALSTVAVWQRDRARKEATRSSAISAFLEETLRSGDPTARGGRAVTVDEVLARAVGRIQSSFANDPETAAELKLTLGSTYSQLGLYDEAEPLLRSSLDLLARTHGESDSSLILPLDSLATVRTEQADYEEAERLYDRALGLSRVFGRDNALEAEILDHLGSLHSRQQHFAAAEQLFERALAIQRQVWASDPAQTAGSLNNLAAVYTLTGRYREAEPLLRRSLALTERELGREHPTVTTVRANLGAVTLGLRRHGEAEPLIVQALATEEKVLGSDHPSVAWIRGLLGWLRVDQERRAEAEALLRSSLKATEGRPGLGVHRGAMLTTLGRLYLDLGRYVEAESALRRSLELADTRPGLPEPAMARLLTILAELSARKGRFEDGEEFCRRAQEAERRIRDWGGDPQLFLADRLKVEALLQAGQGRRGTAEELYRQALAIYEKALGPEHAEATRVRESLSTRPKRER